MIYMFLAAAFGITQDTCVKNYALKFEKFKGSNYLFYGIGAFITCICRAIIDPVIILPIPILLLLVLQSGLGVIVGRLLLKAMSNGPIAGINLVMQCLSYITVVYGIVLYGDEVSFLSVSAAIIFLIVLWLLSPPKENKNNTHGKWFFCAIIAGIMAALAACTQKTISEIGNDEYMEATVFWGALLSLIIYFVAFFATRPYKQKEFISCFVEEKKSAAKAILLYGICGGFTGFMQLKALSTISSLIVYPTLWGLSVIITPIISWIYYHDFKPTFRNITAIILGLFATILNVFA
ncbi:MAG: hypothetical protein IKD04_02695 [Clostridia bacterium]|nr:hypothetical protein [Clostridia bacterium]